MDWNGEDQQVTFNPVLFDEHPNTLTLLSFGADLLDDVLGDVEPPTTAESDGFLTRCQAGAPAPLVGYYAPGNDDQPEPILSLASLRKLLDGDTPPKFSTDQMDQLRDRFLQAVEQYRTQDALVADQIHKARVASLKEAIRQLLLQAAYIELAQTENRGLFDEREALPLDFSEQAVRRLKRHKIPFAGALKLVDVADLRPHPDDSKYTRRGRVWHKL